jgi:two-component system response regulator DesR
MSRTRNDCPRPAGAALAGQLVAVIADPARREMIAGILGRHEYAVASFDSVEAVTYVLGAASPSAIVLWLEDTESPLADLIEPLSRCFQAVPVVVGCESVPRSGVRAWLTAGAAGVVVLEDVQGRLAPCVRAVQAGLLCVPRENWRQVEPPVLSTREKQVLAFVVMGYMNSQIAERLFLAESTVKGHLSSAFGKLGVHSRSEAADLIVGSEWGLGMGLLNVGGDAAGMVVGAA